MHGIASTMRLAGLVAVLGLGVAVGRSAGAEKPPAVGDRARDFELTALGGSKAKLSKVAAEGPVVLVVLRGYPGYQCPACVRQVAEFTSKASAFKKAGARVLFVYPGAGKGLKRAEEFIKGKEYPAHFTFLLDPDYTFTNAYGLRWNARNETAYPATFVIAPDRKVTFASVSKTHGGRVRPEVVLKALARK